MKHSSVRFEDGLVRQCGLLKHHEIRRVLLRRSGSPPASIHEELADTQSFKAVAKKVSRIVAHARKLGRGQDLPRDLPAEGFLVYIC